MTIRSGRPQGRHDAHLHRRRRSAPGDGARRVQQPRHPDQDRRDRRLRGRAGRVRQAPRSARQQSARRPSRQGGRRSRARAEGIPRRRPRSSAELKPGAKIPVQQLFAVGQLVDVQGTSIGKGFAGIIKRHNFSSQRASHGNCRLAQRARLDRPWRRTRAACSRASACPAISATRPSTIQNLDDRAHRRSAPAAAGQGRGPGAKNGPMWSCARRQGQSRSSSAQARHRPAGGAVCKAAASSKLLNDARVDDGLKTIGERAAGPSGDRPVFARDYNEALVHQIVVAFQANARLGTRAQKDRGEVKHSTKKPWRQKGTGRARAGMTSSPLWRGGGRIFPNTPDENFTPEGQQEDVPRRHGLDPLAARARRPPARGRAIHASTRPRPSCWRRS